MKLHQRTYRSYLLRVWCDATGHCWCASLQSTVTQQTIDFATVEALLAFLLAAHSRGEAEVPAHERPQVVEPP